MVIGDNNCIVLGTLNHKRQGKGQPLLVLHGLFGMLDNWQSVAKVLSEKMEVITVDLRNHGRSFHHSDTSYRAMAADVVRLADELGLERFGVLGHSMGGKVAMELALTHESRISHLIVADILPVAYERGHDKVLQALDRMDFSKISSRKEAEHHMTELLEGDRSTALFLLKSLKRLPDKKGFDWRFNLPALTAGYDEIRKPMQDGVFEPPSLFIKGDDSEYIQMDGWIETLDRFPQAQLEVVENAGHWVHADQPDELVRKVLDFVDRPHY